MNTTTAAAPVPTDYDTMILVIPTDSYRTEHYGIAYESVSRHKVTGPNVHNRGYNHTVQVWNNRDGKNPTGKDTTDARWLSLSAQASMITAAPGIPTVYGDDLRVGDKVAIIVSDDDGVRFLGGFEVTNQFLSDPILTPADSIAAETITTA